jgi:hypothetical protein
MTRNRMFRVLGADRAKTTPDRVSFMSVLEAIRDLITRACVYTSRRMSASRSRISSHYRASQRM